MIEITIIFNKNQKIFKKGDKTFKITEKEIDFIVL